MALRATFQSSPGGNIIRYDPVEFAPQETPSGTVNGTNAVFTLANTPVDSSLVDVYRNGLLQVVGALLDYTISGATITFVTPPLIGSVIRVSYWYSLNP